MKQVAPIFWVLALLMAAGCTSSSTTPFQTDLVITPQQLSASGGEQVEIKDPYGFYNLAGVRVLLGQEPCYGVKVVNRNHLRCTSMGSPVAGKVDITVINDGDGQQFLYTQAVTFAASAQPSLGAVVALGGSVMAGARAGHVQPAGQRFSPAAYLARALGVYLGFPVFPLKESFEPSVCDADTATGVYTPDLSQVETACVGDQVVLLDNAGADLRNLAVPYLNDIRDLVSPAGSALVRCHKNILAGRAPAAEDPGDFLTLVAGKSPAVILLGPSVWDAYFRQDNPALMDVEATMAQVLGQLLDLPGDPVVLVVEVFDPSWLPELGGDRIGRLKALYINYLLEQQVAALEATHPQRVFLAPVNRHLKTLATASPDSGQALSLLGQTFAVETGLNGEANFRLCCDSSCHDSRLLGLDLFEGLWGLDGDSLSVTASAFMANSIISVINQHLTAMRVSGAVDYLDLCAVQDEDPLSVARMQQQAQACGFPSLGGFTDPAGQQPYTVGERCLTEGYTMLCPHKVQLVATNPVLDPDEDYTFRLKVLDGREEGVPVENSYFYAWSQDTRVALSQYEGVTDSKGEGTISLTTPPGLDATSIDVYIQSGAVVAKQTFIVRQTR